MESRKYPYSSETSVNLFLINDEGSTLLTVELFDDHLEAMKALSVALSYLPIGGLPEIEDVGGRAFGVGNDSPPTGTVYAVLDHTYVHVITYSLQEAKRLSKGQGSPCVRKRIIW